MGLKLIQDSVEALDIKRGSAEDYRNILIEINSLREALENVESLLSGESLPHRQRTALERSSLACQTCIDEFLYSIAKYQPHLNAFSKGFTPSFRKIKWALCKKEDVANFRAQLGRHASSINMLLITFQAKQNLASNQSATSSVTTSSVDNNLVEMMQTMSLEQRQCFLFIVQQNRDLMQSLQDMRQMLSLQTTLPPQVLLQPPVILLDPFGKLAPFHLEFIDSPECFVAVMRARFSNAGVRSGGLSKLDNHEFAIEDTRRKKPIDITKPWVRVFRPGQEVDMRMTFHRFACPPSTCPGCLELNEDDGEQVQCHACGLFYQNIQAISRQSREWEQHLPRDHDIEIHGEQIPYILRHPQKEPELKAFQPPEEKEDDSFEGYRRIQIISQPLALLDPRFPALQLIEDFIHFADLLDDVPLHVSPYRSEIKELHSRARHFIRQRDGDFPAFSSFSHIEQMRKRLTMESLTLRHYIDILIRNLCNDPETKVLVMYLKQKPTTGNRTGYYAGALGAMVNISESAKSKESRIPRPVSKDKVEWLMLDSSRK
ncbi:MAG: hypothetical protein Q9164_003361 [Protoblastenia rupestris]